MPEYRSIEQVKDIKGAWVYRTEHIGIIGVTRRVIEEKVVQSDGSVKWVLERVVKSII